MPAKIEKATLSQTAVTTGIVFDKLRIARGQGLEPDPAMELCRSLGINRSTAPATLTRRRRRNSRRGYSAARPPKEPRRLF